MEVELKLKRFWILLAGCILLIGGAQICQSFSNLIEALIRGQSYLFELFLLVTILLMVGLFLASLAFREEQYLTEEGIRFENARTIFFVRWLDCTTIKLKNNVLNLTYLAANGKPMPLFLFLDVYRPESRRALIEMLREKRPDIFPVETSEKKPS